MGSSLPTPGQIWVAQQSVQGTWVVYSIPMSPRCLAPGIDIAPSAVLILHTMHLSTVFVSCSVAGSWWDVVPVLFAHV